MPQPQGQAEGNLGHPKSWVICPQLKLSRENEKTDELKISQKTKYNRMSKYKETTRQMHI